MTVPDKLARISGIPCFWASRAPDLVAIFDGEQRTTFGELWARIQKARAFFESRGAMPGDRVVIVGENCTPLIVMLFALSEIGAWPVVVNARLSDRELSAICAHCEPRLVMFTHDVSPDALRHGERLGARMTVADGIGAVLCSDADSNARPESGTTAREVAILIYTSGTTGQPKGVMVTHRGLLHFARVSAISRDLKPGDCAYAVLPMSHIFGVGTLLLATLYGGASLHLCARFDPGDVIEAIESGAISILQGVPTMFTRVVSYLRESGRTVGASKLRYLYTGGSLLDLTLKREVEARFGQPLHHGYGMTEYAGSLAVTRIERPRQDCSAGEIVEGAELRVLDENRNLVPRGMPGELWVRGPGVMRGYYRAPQATAEVVDPDGWLDTGDIGTIDADGALFIVGRSKDLIIRSGFNVYPVEVETVINSFDGVRQSAVVGRRTEDSNEEVIAFVEFEAGATADVDTLNRHLAARLSPYKRPSRIIVIPEIPTTASGKLMRHVLRAMAQDDHPVPSHRSSATPR
ncbi:acyl-CoA synthetase (AMP-forming)/AMP-acid ligase II [Paraburkholderia sp. HC6.4b]|uniref:class I adenylate-forming enzyme family protein n=1 Tax=unclassified Paraburkholderia TaxID=2615204 RepID=UPI001614EAB9|nr:MULTISPECIES: class I adenylate-forming enzyme family protein [unclassified Paraburkholderia]MBB5406378.1 acyl-CoA synthetase (AMP-forming)/AMP-acid ligase II [Paraburkholderia sp. HC6.4b]MBB5448776.1 acyl-CoA synthetase (AMP-forming)/AMP-acid ligase II [Paraburkholderia sp. Kb1A]